jgi:hypothetical protein
MNRGHLTPVVVALMLLAGSAAAATLQPTNALVEREHERTALKDARAKQLAPAEVTPAAGCTPIPLSPPATINGTINTASCYDSVINGYEDIYNLAGVAGQTVTIDYSSTQYEAFLYMDGVSTQITSFLSSGVSRRRIVYTFPTTRNYKLETETLYGPGDGQPYAGNYTLIVTASGGPSCVPNSATMCLNNERFAVSATYSTGTSNGTAQAVKLTSDSGYLTFFSTSNIEVVIKVLDGCGINSRYWVYAGGLTNVNAVITVRDTKTGSVRTYTNPLNTAFQPIQDTGALSVCP